jgi:CheY-like chemotaxis protein
MSDLSKRILVVDDQAMFRLLISSVINKSPLRSEIHEAADGNEATQVLDQHSFDLVITDLNMPGMGGMALIEHVRTHPRNRFTKICVISGDDDAAEQQRARKSGANAFVMKPIDKHNLIDTVARLLR